MRKNIQLSCCGFVFLLVIISGCSSTTKTNRASSSSAKHRITSSTESQAETTEQKAKREREEREAKRKTAADAVMQNLEVKFLHMSETELQATPGANLNGLRLMAKNNGSEPVKGLGLIIGPADCLGLELNPSDTSDCARKERSKFKLLTVKFHHVVDSSTTGDRIP